MCLTRSLPQISVLKEYAYTYCLIGIPINPCILCDTDRSATAIRVRPDAKNTFRFLHQDKVTNDIFSLFLFSFPSVIQPSHNIIIARCQTSCEQADIVNLAYILFVLSQAPKGRQSRYEYFSTLCLQEMQACTLSKF